MTRPTSVGSDTRTATGSSVAAEMDAINERAAAEAAELAALLETYELTPEMLLTLASTRLKDMDQQVHQLMQTMNDATAQARLLGQRIMELRGVMTALEGAYDREGNLSPDAVLPGRAETQTFEEALDDLVAAGIIPPATRALLRDGTDDEIRAAMAGDPLVRDSVYAAQSQLGAWGFHDARGFHRDHVRTSPQTVRQYLAELVENGTLTDEERTAVLAGRDGLQTLIDGVNDELRVVNSDNEMNMIRLQSVMQQRTALISATTNLLKSMDEGNDAVIANLR